MQRHNQAQEAERIYSRDPFVYGSSQWATKRILAENGYHHSGKLFYGYGMPESTKEGAYPLTSDTEKHILTVAATRSGKALTSSVPACMEHQGSLFALDIKSGELATITARYRRDVLGKKVVIIDPWNEVCSKLGFEQSRFNIFDVLDPESDDLVDDALLIADSLVPDKGSKDPFWVDEARALVMGLVLYIAATPTILMPTEKKTRDIPQIRRLLNLGPDAFKNFVAGEYEENEEGELELTSPGMAQSSNEFVRNAAARILSKAPKEFSSILSTTQQNTHFLESPKIQKALSGSDFSLDEMMSGNLDIYIALPASRIFTHYRFLRLLVSTAITAITRFPNKPQRPVYFLLEEGAALGRMETVETAYGLMAGYGIQLHMIVQDFNQLRSLYGDRWQTFIANSGVIQVFGTRDLFTAEYVSRLCGTTTVEALSAYSAEKRAGLVSDPDFFSRHDSVISRPLITPDEIMTLPPSQQILFFSNLPPIKGYKTIYFMEKRYRMRNGKPLFDIHPNFANRPLSPSFDFEKAGLPIQKILSSIFDGK